jgi:predicted nucleotidyltransferase
MTSVDQVKQVINQKRSQLSSKGITEIGIFGSYIRGDARPDSDIDILIDISRPARIDLFDLISLEDELSQALNTKVDLVLKSNLRPAIGKTILSEVFQAPNKASEQIKKDRTIPKQIEKQKQFNSFYIKELRTISNNIERNRNLPASPSKPCIGSYRRAEPEERSRIGQRFESSWTRL